MLAFAQKFLTDRTARGPAVVSLSKMKKKCSETCGATDALLYNWRTRDNARSASAIEIVGLLLRKVHAVVVREEKNHREGKS